MKRSRISPRKSPTWAAVSKTSSQPKLLAAVHRATDGIPRLINQVCDHALILAFAGGVRRIGPPGIEEAWADLQQLPTPWNAAAGAAEPTPDIIEFGALDEDVIPLKSIQEASASPRLRAVSEEDEAGLFYGEPGDRLEKIEAKLDTIDQDYQPPAFVEPEVEIVFPAAIDPFGDDFLEEEVVVDRFAEMEFNVLANRPLVHSAEGRALSALLPPHGADADAPPTDADGRANAEGRPSDSPYETRVLPPADAFDDDRSWDLSAEFDPSAESATEQGVAADILILHPADDPVFPEEPAAVGAMTDVPNAAAGPAEDAAAPDVAHSGTPFPRIDERDPLGEASDRAVQVASIPADMLADDDRDLIVVEDDPPEPPPPASPPPVRRQEYRQLFARLRRG